MSENQSEIKDTFAAFLKRAKFEVLGFTAGSVFIMTAFGAARHVIQLPAKEIVASIPEIAGVAAVGAVLELACAYGILGKLSPSSNNCG